MQNKNINVKNIQSHYGSPKLAQAAYSSLAILFVVFFAVWWFQPGHIPTNFIGTSSRVIDYFLFALVSYIIWQPISMDILTWAISSHIKDVRNQKPVPGSRVAFITTIVPSSESLDLLHKCLPSMVNASYEHDTWLLDEGNNSEVKEICRKYGVFHFTRKGVNEFNTTKGKFTRTKGGNHNSWYEVHGDKYDFVAQIDTDFVPKRTFLTRTLGYFRDPKVAFVGTPQVYGNINTSIIAKGAAEQLYTFYGSVLKGLSSMNMTLLIGANHVIRVKALKKVNHYTAHITEDLITGMKLHSRGWKSVYLSEPLAVGEGPSTWESYFSQQMRWAYGCMDIFFSHSFGLFKKMGLRKAIYYFFLQQHYFTGIAMVLSILLLSLYFFAGLRAADVDLYRFFIFYSVTLLVCWLMSIYLQRYDVFRKNEGELLLAGKVISIAAWPVWVIAFISILIGKRLSYKVTPKGEGDTRVRKSFGIFIPHIFLGSITVIGLISSFYTGRQNSGMIFWAITSGLLMFSVPFAQEIYDFIKGMQRKIVRIMRASFLFFKKIDKKISFKIFSEKKGGSIYGESGSSQGVIFDLLFLVIIVGLSFSYYVGGIGFYSDDWSFLGNFSVTHDQSLLGLFQSATTPNTFMRPVQNLYEAFLYWFFGIQPLGYQLVNVFTFMVIAGLFYIVLRQLKLPRIIALTIPLVYILLPNYSTDRFWFAVHQANLSMVFYLFSLLAALKAVSVLTIRKTMWKGLSIGALVLSILSYEVVVPLFILNILILWNPFNKFQHLQKGLKSSNAVFITAIVISLLYTLLFKALTTQRLSEGISIQYIINTIVSAFNVNYGFWVINFPRVWGEILSRYSDPFLLAFCAAFYMIVFLYLYMVVSRSKSLFPELSWMRNLTFFSFFIFILGYFIFFTNNQVGFSPTGIENRVAIGAAIGVAMTIIGLVGWVSRIFLSDKYSRVFFSIIIAIVCTGSFLTVNTIASFWVEANNKSQIVLKDIHEQFPLVARKTTIIVDGVCPYVGPAPVFEADWDLKGALQTYYLDSTLRADIVTPRLRVNEKGLSTTIYTFTTTYPYKNLYIYNYKNKQIFQIENSGQAYDYFSKYNSDYNNGCPNAEAGNGVSIFNES